MRAQVVLVHEGEAVSGQADGSCDDGGPGAKLGGRIKEIAEGAVPAVDLIISGHSHSSYECRVDDPSGRRRLVTQADSFGRSFTDLRFDLNATGDVVRSTVQAQFRPVPVETAQQPATAKLIDTWRARSEGVANRVVGYISADMPGRGSTQPETPLGGFLADAQVAAGQAHGADLALLNPGGMRADPVFHDGGAVTYADAYRVQPFETPLWVLPVTGADRLLADTVRIKGQPVALDTTYQVVLNEFLANGGNGFTVFGEITAREGGELTDLEALVDHLEATTSATDPAVPPAPGRIAFGTH